MTGTPERRRCENCEDGSVSPAYCPDEDFQPCPECWGSMLAPSPEPGEGDVSDIVRAPFTDEQVAGLARWQACRWVHPFTCGNETHLRHVDLFPTPAGWVCPVEECDYVQDWAHDFMAAFDGNHPNDRLFGGER